MATRLPGQVRGDAVAEKSPLDTGAGATDLPLYFRPAYLGGFAGHGNHDASPRGSYTTFWCHDRLPPQGP